MNCSSVDILVSHTGNSYLPVLVASDYLALLLSKVPDATPVLGWSTHHGLDPVWARIHGEGLLKPWQLPRLEGLVEGLYKNPTTLPAQEVGVNGFYRHIL